MPTVSGVTDGKTPYGGAQISLFSASNSNTSSGGSISGSMTYRWSLTWDDNNGFTGLNWIVDNFEKINKDNVWDMVDYYGSGIARWLVANGKDGGGACATYYAVP